MKKKDPFYVEVSATRWLAQEIGKKLKDARANSGMTQQELGDSVEKTQSHMAAIEKGIALPSLTLLYRMAAVLDLHGKDLLP